MDSKLDSKEERIIKNRKFKIVITEYSTHTGAVCECGWQSVDKKTLRKKVSDHRSSHSPRAVIEYKKFNAGGKINIFSEVLLVAQDFESGDLGHVYDFTLDDFRKEGAPLFSEKHRSKYKKFYRIEMQRVDSKCPWGYSRWVTGDNGKLKMKDHDWDSSG